MQSRSHKQLALEAIQRLPDNVDFDEIMYRLYLLGKTLKGMQDIEAGRTISHDELVRKTTLGERQQYENEPHDHDDMPAEIDFSGGAHGKPYGKDAHLQLPIRLEISVQNTLVALANAKGVDLSVFVNDLLKKDIELIQMAR